jgi:restriction endonuclease S subunit
MQITVANFSEAIRNERFDSQFFRPEFVNSYNKVISHKYSLLSDIAHITDGNHLKIAEDFDSTEGIRYLRGQDLSTDMMLNDRNIVYIPESIYDTLKRSHIYKYDVLITIVGANTGLVGLVYSPPKKLVANCKLGIARANKGEIQPGYLYAFLTCKYGQHQMLRSIRGGGQTGLILPDMRQLPVTRLLDKFENAVSNVVLTGHEKILESKETFSEAQELLLAELGLSAWHPKHQLSFVKHYSDINEVGRIDAEYFQPKYDEIARAIKGYPGGWNNLGDLCEIVGHPSNPPYADTDVINKTFIVAQNNLGDCFLDDAYWQNEDAKYTTDDFCRKNEQYLLQQDDLVLYTVGGPPHLGKANIVIGTHIKFTIGSFVTLVRGNKKKINPYFLLVLFNSFVGKLLTNKFQRGMVQQYIYPKDLIRTPIPLIEESTQIRLQQKVTESFNLRKQSKHLLECAKRAVEIAIEQNEDAAIKWLQKQTKEAVSCCR